MSNDRELLELAAKAAGLRIDKSETNGGGRGNTGFDMTGNAVLDWQSDQIWNPLTKDGDALRLATKLGICITFIPDCDTVQVFQRNEYAEVFNVKVEAMDDFGVRRAIVRAAADIGRSMP